MAENIIFKRGDNLEIAVASGVTSGDPVVVGNLTGVALTDRDSDGNASVKFNGVADLSVKAIDDDGNSAVVLGDVIYWTTGDTPQLNKKNSGTGFGVALEGVTSAATATIKVKLQDIAALASLAAGSVDTTQLAADAVTGAKIEDDAVDSEHIAAGAIDNEHLAVNSVDSDNYIDGSIDEEHLADGAVGIDKLNANQQVKFLSVFVGDVSATATYTIAGMIKACEVISAVFITATADAVDGTNFWTIAVVNKEQGSGSDVVATQNSDSGAGNTAFVAFQNYDLVVATDGKEDIGADDVLVLVATKAASADTLTGGCITLEIKMVDA